MNSALVHTLPAGPFRRAQRRHFLLSVALPHLGLLLLPALWPWLWPGVLSQGAAAAAIGLGMWYLVGGVGVSVGLHRHFSHRSFEAAPALRWLLGALGSMAAQGSVVYWVALHRMHHAASDRPGDPHSPQRQAWNRDSPQPMSRWRAAWQGHLGWVLAHDVPKPTRYARELIGDELVRRLGRSYGAWVAAGFVLPALVGWAWLGGSLGDWQGALFGAYWGGVVRLALGHHVIWAINSCCHLVGARPHPTPDSSRNVAWLALLSWGESWHNNHHAAPTSARFGGGWGQPDIGWWTVRLFVALRWARLRPTAPTPIDDGPAKAHCPSAAERA